MAFLKIAAWYAREYSSPARHTSSFTVYRNTDGNLRFSIAGVFRFEVNQRTAR